jgi:hypothetical protein
VEVDRGQDIQQKIRWNADKGRTWRKNGRREQNMTERRCWNRYYGARRASEHGADDDQINAGRERTDRV